MKATRCAAISAIVASARDRGAERTPLNETRAEWQAFPAFLRLVVMRENSFRKFAISERKVKVARYKKLHLMVKPPSYIIHDNIRKLWQYYKLKPTHIFKVLYMRIIFGLKCSSIIAKNLTN